MRNAMRVLILGLIGLAACGGGDGQTVSERCTESAQVLCDRIYECFTAAEREEAGLPATEAGCVTSIEAEAGCARATASTYCEGNRRYHADEHEDCIEQMRTASCGQISSDTDSPAPACDRICTVE